LDPLFGDEYPRGIVVDASGNVYFSDSFNNVVRKINAATGIITTYAGNGLAGYSGDNGPAASAELSGPEGISLNSTGDLFIADSSNFRVREVFAATGLIATVAGTAKAGYNGDGIPATTAELLEPLGVRVAANGNMYIADYGEARVRVVGAIAQTPSFTWLTPAPIYYGTALSAAQLDASSNGIAGTITYSEAVGTVLKAGTYNLSALFVPTSSDYSIETAEVLLTVNPAPAPVTWTQPADIAKGAALSATQLNATSTIAGTFVYSPGLGTVLTLGPHLLTATFTPTDTIDYRPSTVSVAITVSQGTTTYDSGTVSFVANTTTLATVSYGQSSTPTTIASALATAVNGASGTPVKVTAVDDALFITAVTPGVAGDSITYSISDATYDSTDFAGPSFPSAPISGNLDGGAAAGTDAGKLVYSYSDGYDHVGNMLASNDLVMGHWTFTPDTLNRLASATNLPVSSTSTSYYCWSYDGFGNRTLQGISSAAFAAGPPACTPQTSASYDGVWAHVSTGNNNRFSNTQQATAGVVYDAAGNILNDGVNQYLYDGEGQICAVATEAGSPQLSGYIYNAQGQQIAKGRITAWSCDPTVNGFKPMSDYVLGQSGEQVTEMGMNASGVMAWQHTNVYALGQLIATYDNDGLHFYLNDPLGTRRAQTDYAGVLEQTCASLPFGDALNCTNSLQFPTEHHFTGKERDVESGNDYFGARYFASTMGRFLSPDWSDKPEDVPYAQLADPQSLNLYAYVRNNPLTRVDPDGHCSGFECQLINDWNSTHGISNAQQQQAQSPCAQHGCGGGTPQAFGAPGVDPSKAPTLADLGSLSVQAALLFGTDGLGELAEAGAALSRATELANAMGKTKDFVTIAVTETQEGTTIVSSSENALRPAVRALLKDGEIAAKGAGHAEVTGVSAAKQLGLNPTGVAASRGICPSCAEFLRDAGIAALSALRTWF